MRSDSLRRYPAVFVLLLFLQSAAFSPWLHACCMEIGAGEHAGHGTSHEANGGSIELAQADHAAHAEMAHAQSDAHASHSSHGGEPASAAAHAHDAPDSESESGSCCCAACECCVTAGIEAGVSASAQIHAPTLVPATEFRLPAAPSLGVTAFLLPFANGPPAVSGLHALI